MPSIRPRQKPADVQPIKKTGKDVVKTEPKKSDKTKKA